MATLEQALETASQLPPEQQDMLAEILRQRHNEAWRQNTAEEARESIAGFHAGKLTIETGDDAIARLRTMLDSTASQ